ncbi:hypothetical protein BTO20_37490 (plasmid) [Mycobacterium dioxanotrophicus]|jgi:pimeloyl-ACP methyl ester carboxylesterase|uniref:AB hydrolase-1 domain-containing protein n=1 Tax=Mycobacterium dioxanotrophicus TaxID=482462 RepID=A0A1Y0CGD9_9MYCO|nr:alpha/beta hydrolase [Mycobacterium dioxanotrophicus]ART74320.1 hypothetical protein BTO20_37490 [Mycobacterium dioxanotrophicus]
MTATTSACAYRTRSVITTDGVRLACRDYGRGDAEHTVILLHGFCLDQSTWTLQVRELTRQWGRRLRIISFDYRGHGQSSPACTHTYTIGQLAQDLSYVLTALDVTSPVTLAGHSMGGMAALTYLSLAQRPIEPVGLVLVASAAGRLAQRGIGRLLAIPGLGGLAGLVEHLPHHAAQDIVRALALPAGHALTHLVGLTGSERAAFSRTAAGALTRTTIAAAIGFLPSLRTYDQRATLANIAAHTTVISGGKDLVTPSAHAAELVVGIAGSIHVHQAHAGHMLLHDAAAAVTDAISHTIASAAAAAPVAR